MEGYQELSLRTRAEDFPAPSRDELHLLHCVVGLAGEIGELQDLVKRAVFYGQELNVANIVEELGDLEWYAAGIRHLLGITQSEVQNLNITKLAKRYPDKFSGFHSRYENRNLDAEKSLFDDFVEKGHVTFGETP